MAECFSEIRLDVEEFKELMIQDRELKTMYLSKDWSNFISDSPVNNKNFQKIEAKRGFINNLLSLLLSVLEKDPVKITSPSELLSMVDNVFAHPIADINFLILRIMDAILSGAVGDISTDIESIGKILTYLFNTMKRRSFDLESVDFHCIVARIMSLCMASQPQLLDASFKIFSKISRKALVF
jgi:hypothetical protein